MKYLELLEELKGKHLSVVIRKLREDLLKKLTSPLFSAEMRSFMVTLNEDEVPFRDFEEEPAPVSQIKKGINALYHLEQALLDVEKTDFRLLKPIQAILDLRMLYSKTLHHVYLALFPLMHFDVSLPEIFANEIATLRPILAQLFSLAVQYQQRATLPKQEQIEGIVKNTGLAVGVMLDQMQANSGEVDYEFITQFTARIPHYLDRLNLYVAQLSESIVKHGPSIDKKKLEGLQADASQLLHSLENLKANRFVVSIKIINYIFVVRHTIILTMSIFKEIGHVTDSTQDILREKLALLKYKVLPELFEVIEKIEVEFMLVPGTLSKPTMEKISRLYDLCIQHLQKIIDFNAKGRELLTLEDDRFLQLRLQNSYQRISEHNRALALFRVSEIAVKNFFAILRKDKYKSLRLCELPPFTRKQLLIHFSFFHHLVRQIEPHMYNIILVGLNPSSHIVRSSSFLAEGQVTKVIPLERALQSQLRKAVADHQFHVQLNENMVASVILDSNPAVYPCRSLNPYLIDERKIFQSPSHFENSRFNQLDGEYYLDHPSGHQVVDLIAYYDFKLQEIARAQIAYEQFLRLVELWELGDTQNIEKRSKFQKWYSLFQAHFYFSALGMHTVAFDKALVNCFNEDQSSNLTQEVILENLRPLGNILATAQDRFEQKKKEMVQLFKKQTSEEGELEKLSLLSPAARAEFIISHTHFSKFSHDLRGYIQQIFTIFNQPMRRELTPMMDQVPYPEMVSDQVALEVPEVLGILRRLSNSAFHLHQAAVHLEELREKSTEVTFVLTFLKAAKHFREIAEIVKRLANTPFIYFIKQDLEEKLQAFKKAFLGVKEIYVWEIPPAAPEMKGKDAITLVLNALLLLPVHIEKRVKKQPLRAEEVEASRSHSQNLARTIADIIVRSDSSFQLFLSLPTMYGLYTHLQEKLSILSTCTHDTVTAHLEDIKNTCLVDLLNHADEWEDKLFLQPGLISNPLSRLLDIFFKGLLEPLNLSSSTHLNLIDNIAVYDKRVLKQAARIESAVVLQNELHEHLEKIKEFEICLSDFQRENTTHPSDQETLQQKNSCLKHAFLALHPFLVKERPFLASVNAGKGHASSITDSLLNAYLSDESARLENIEFLVRVAKSWCKGMIRTQKLIIDSANEKIAHLASERQVQEQVHKKYKLEYANRIYRRLLKPASLHCNFIHVNDEYSEALRAVLRRHQPALVEEALRTDNVKESLENAISLRVLDFEQENYKKYNQLESIMAVFAQLNSYVEKSRLHLVNSHPLFENADTLHQKSALIAEAEAIASDKEQEVEERLSLLHEKILSHRFEETILAYHIYEPFTYGWLKQWMFSVFELLHLYTPDHKKLLNELKGLANEPLIAPSRCRAALFTPPPPGRRVYSLPPVDENGLLNLSDNLSRTTP
ncbi:SdhA, GRIP coiled-coil protein GCC185 (plasmid) [Legionella adelaidensis]|uniref:SdhA, GRIP coiled-coil protein GCC185 n=1 Tax=Legionella adelaidensis TaxID=45056 RepID=A0A0W0R2Z5_9GAMM|nr:hypothetical protein [Legionella adelaidensis]KTC65386.1 SdhA, substrate of the Dot/Icm system [Legionella adelaidensis]VEH84792.1 SdhA, GRIP coiled-coil protein GCC185 [Legionella adelaidensis]